LIVDDIFRLFVELSDEGGAVEAAEFHLGAAGLAAGVVVTIALEIGAAVRILADHHARTADDAVGKAYVSRHVLRLNWRARCEKTLSR
jgi:hypothetical protein